MSQKLIISDFDRTLFDVNTFFLDFCNLALGDESLKNSEIRANIQDHINSGNHADWQLFMTRYHIDLQNIVGKIKHALGSNSYLYPDVGIFLHRFKNEKVVIMTTGRQEFQEVKLQLVGEFAGLEKIIIPGNKGEYIASHLELNGDLLSLPKITGASRFSEIYLIDDKTEMLKPLLGVKHARLFHIVREDSKFPERSNEKQIVTINTLDEVL